MQVNVSDLQAKPAGTIELSDAVFGQAPRRDILQRMVIYQLARRQSGNHKSKTYGEVEGSTAKIYKQKGTGRARHGAKRAPQFRGGGKAFGPVVRSHAIDLPKKVRKLALRSALSAKQAEGKLVVIDEARLEAARTKALVEVMGRFGWDSVLIVDGAAVNENLRRAAANLPHVDVLPQQGANVYDILRRDTLVLTKAAVEHLEARLK
ncbi:MAG TPA: 50S ribosomal protein L4 [Candidatus Sulfotelmatobacter sp.]|nr:50S ribosomal protein L4 [Candidatus Sulfotelmatobacter sp.]